MVGNDNPEASTTMTRYQRSIHSGWLRPRLPSGWVDPAMNIVIDGLEAQRLAIMLEFMSADIRTLSDWTRLESLRGLSMRSAGRLTGGCWVWRQK